MRVEHEEGAACFLFLQNSPGGHTGNGSVPAFAPCNGRGRRKPECTFLRYGKPILLVQYGRVFSFRLTIVPTYANVRIILKICHEVSHLVVQSFLYTEQVRVLSLYQCINFGRSFTPLV